LPDALEAIGAIQAQYRPSIPAALWTRIEGFRVSHLQEALERREVVVGTLLRNTIHAVSADEYPYYSGAVEASGVFDWRRTKSAWEPEMVHLRDDILQFANSPRNQEELTAFVEEWLDSHQVRLDPSEAERQRQYDWRAVIRWARLIRVGTLLAAPPSGSRPATDEAVDHVVRAHLRAFGPASAADVAAWTALKITAVKASLARLNSHLDHFRDEAGRQLFDLTKAPRPDAETPAPVRLLPWFDSVLLAYEPGERARILPREYRDRVYLSRNLQWLPTILVDGFVAGTWSAKLDRKNAGLALAAFVKLGATTRRDLEAEAEALIRVLQPEARSYEVAFQSK
jgi:Winged helix DNA-binding domain